MSGERSCRCLVFLPLTRSRQRRNDEDFSSRRISLRSSGSPKPKSFSMASKGVRSSHAISIMHEMSAGVYEKALCIYVPISLVTGTCYGVARSLPYKKAPLSLVCRGFLFLYLRLFQIHAARIITHAGGPIGEDTNHTHIFRQHMQSIHHVAIVIDSRVDSLVIPAAAIF